MLLTDKGKLLLIFFCQSVELVIANNAMKDDTTPITGSFEPISNPKTNVAPTNPRAIPLGDAFLSN